MSWFDVFPKEKNDKIRKKLYFITSPFLIVRKIFNKVSTYSSITLNKSCESFSFLVINCRYEGERNLSLNEKWELESNVFIQTNNRRYLWYKNEVICSDSSNLFFLNYDKKQMLRKWLLLAYVFYHCISKILINCIRTNHLILILRS